MLQWTKQHWQYQLIYILYRWFIAVYAAGWLIASGAYTRHALRWFIFITNWCTLLLTAYLLAAAISTTYKMIKEFGFAKQKPNDLIIDDLYDPVITTSCGCGEQGGIPWYLSVTWVLFLVSSELSIPVVLFYWTSPDDMITHWGVTLHIHFLVLIPGLVDVLVSGIPVRLFHFVYIVGVAAVYAVFAGVYYAAGGTDTDGNRYIYEILDFGNRPTTSALLIIVMVFGLTIIVHLIFWGLYLLRTSLLCQKLPKDLATRQATVERPHSLNIVVSGSESSCQLMSVPTPNPNLVSSSPAGSEVGLLVNNVK